jgi:hypothetical protein
MELALHSDQSSPSAQILVRPKSFFWMKNDVDRTDTLNPKQSL